MASYPKLSIQNAVNLGLNTNLKQNTNILLNGAKTGLGNVSSLTNPKSKSFSSAVINNFNTGASSPKVTSSFKSSSPQQLGSISSSPSSAIPAVKPAAVNQAELAANNARTTFNNLKTKVSGVDFGNGLITFNNTSTANAPVTHITSNISAQTSNLNLKNTNLNSGNVTKINSNINGNGATAKITNIVSNSNGTYTTYMSDGTKRVINQQQLNQINNVKGITSVTPISNGQYQVRLTDGTSKTMSESEFRAYDKLSRESGKTSSYVSMPSSTYSGSVSTPVSAKVKNITSNSNGTYTKYMTDGTKTTITQQELNKINNAKGIVNVTPLNNGQYQVKLTDGTTKTMSESEFRAYDKMVRENNISSTPIRTSATVNPSISNPVSAKVKNITPNSDGTYTKYMTDGTKTTITQQELNKINNAKGIVNVTPTNNGQYQVKLTDGTTKTMSESEFRAYDKMVRENNISSTPIRTSTPISPSTPVSAKVKNITPNSDGTYTKYMTDGTKTTISQQELNTINNAKGIVNVTPTNNGQYQVKLTDGTTKTMSESEFRAYDKMVRENNISSTPIRTSTPISPSTPVSAKVKNITPNSDGTYTKYMTDGTKTTISQQELNTINNAKGIVNVTPTNNGQYQVKLTDGTTKTMSESEFRAYDKMVRENNISSTPITTQAPIVNPTQRSLVQDTVKNADGRTYTQHLSDGSQRVIDQRQYDMFNSANKRIVNVTPSNDGNFTVKFDDGTTRTMTNEDYRLYESFGRDKGLYDNLQPPTDTPTNDDLPLKMGGEPFRPTVTPNTADEVKTPEFKPGDTGVIEDPNLIDYNRIARSADRVQQENFLGREHVWDDQWGDNGKLNYEVRDDGTILIKEDGVPMGYTDYEGLKNLGVTPPANNNPEVIPDPALKNSGVITDPNMIDFNRIARSEDRVLNGQFLDKDRVDIKEWGNDGELTYERRDDGSILIKENGQPLGFTDEKGLNIPNDSISETPSEQIIPQQSQPSTTPTIQTTANTTFSPKISNVVRNSDGTYTKYMTDGTHSQITQQQLNEMNNSKKITNVVPINGGQHYQVHLNDGTSRIMTASDLRSYDSNIRAREAVYNSKGQPVAKSPTVDIYTKTTDAKNNLEHNNKEKYDSINELFNTSNKSFAERHDDMHDLLDSLRSA